MTQEAASTISTLADVMTAAGVLIAAVQLLMSRRQSVTEFEDSFSKEYRELASDLPTKALLGEALSEEEHDDAFDEFYHYFDLCNEQVFLHMNGRISEETWSYWRDGILANMRRPAFKRAWREVSAKTLGEFTELKSILHNNDAITEQ